MGLFRRILPKLRACPACRGLGKAGIPVAAKGRPRILVAAGGTGGHIMPGLSLALELQKQGAELYFLSLHKNRCQTELRDTAFPVYFYKAPPFPRKCSRSLLAFPFRFFVAFAYSIRLLLKNKIDILIGMGGYPTVPALLAARLLSRPYDLCEQNALPGMANYLFAKKARHFFVNFPLAQDRKVSKAQLRELGNPMRPRLRERALSFKKYPVLDTKKALHILVLGGSQGALQVNRIALGAAERLGEGCQWSIQCGEAHLASFQEELQAKNLSNIACLGYQPDIEELYCKADLAFCRAGAGVLSEALCFGLALLLLPYPYASDAHQEANSAYLVSAGAAMLFGQKDTSPSALVEALTVLKKEPEKLHRMQKAALSLAKPDAAIQAASCILSAQST